MTDLFCIPIPNATDKFIIYRPAIHTAFVGNEAMATMMRNAAIAKQKGLPVHINEDTQHLLDALYFWREVEHIESDPALSPFAPTTAVLLFTNRCNLRCGYCYADAGIHQPRDLTYEMATCAIDYVCKQAQNQGLAQFKVDFHGGGEPTVMWERLKACAEYARQQPIAATLSLTSNVTWTPRIRDWIITNINELSLSIDGSPITQNRNRPLADGSGSYKIVADNLAFLDAADKEYGIRITATPPWNHLHDDVLSLCEHYKCRELQVEPAFNAQRGQRAITPTREDCQEFSKAFLAAFDCAKIHGRKLFFSGVRIGTKADTFCKAPYDALIVTPDGDLTTCFEVEGPSHPLFTLSHIGQIHQDNIQINWQQRALLHNLMRERRQACTGCFCESFCAGYCYTRTFKPELNGHLNFGTRCEMNRNIFIQILLRLIAEGNGIWQLYTSHYRNKAVG